MPIVRTFAPFVAGIGTMDYQKFLLYNVVGGVIWVGMFTFAGYFFGNIAFIKQNFHYAVIVIIVLSILPMVYEYIVHKRNPDVPGISTKKVKDYCQRVRSCSCQFTGNLRIRPTTLPWILTCVVKIGDIWALAGMSLMRSFSK